MDIPIIEYDKSKRQWIDRKGNVYARDVGPVPPRGPGRGTVVVAARWEKILSFSSNLEMRRMIRGALQTRCGGCKTLVVLSLVTQDILKETPAATILCHSCYQYLKELNGGICNER